MKYAEREVRNGILINLQKAGISQKVISQVVKLSQQRVSKILVAEARGVPTNLKPPGYQRRLTEEQLAALPKLLAQGAESYGFSGAYWTHERVREVLEKEYQVVYEKKQVGRILGLLNWTRQKPPKKEAKQDLQKVEKWKTEELPALKKKALEEEYEIYYHDESTLQLCANVSTTYSPRGKTPVLELYDTKGYQYVCVASSISASGKLFYQIRNNSFKGAGIIE